MESVYKLFGIYRITNKVTGMSYIGKTSMNFGDRWDSHRSLLNSGTHSNPGLQSDWNEYGSDSFEFAVIQVVDDVATLDDLEIKYIAEYRTSGLSYNLHDGGSVGYNLGKHLSEETKKKIGEKNREHMTGRKLSDETKKRMSQSQSKRFESWTEDDRKRWGKMTSEAASGYKWSEEAKANFSRIQKERPNGAKFTPDDIRAIRRKKAGGATLKELAEEYNTSPAYISSIVHRRRWSGID